MNLDISSIDGNTCMYAYEYTYIYIFEVIYIYILMDNQEAIYWGKIDTAKAIYGILFIFKI